jgi:hypothetical protein
MWKKVVIAQHPTICLEELRKTMYVLDQNSQPLGQESKMDAPEYEEGVPTTQL